LTSEAVEGVAEAVAAGDAVGIAECAFLVAAGEGICAIPELTRAKQISAAKGQL